MNDHGFAKININVAMLLQVLPQIIPLLWQLISHKHIVFIPELLRCHTIIMVNYGEFYLKTHTDFQTMKKVSFFFWITLVSTTSEPPPLNSKLEIISQKELSLGSRLLCLIVTLSLSHWYPGSGVLLDCIDS